MDNNKYVFLTLLFFFSCYSNSSIARFLQSDPIGIDGGMNTYLYANANPIRYIDPTGEAPGDLFASPDDAAIDAGNYSRARAMQTIEYGGWIFPVGQCFTYNFTPGLEGTIPISIMRGLRPDNPVAAWHTHNAGRNAANNENFSGSFFVPGSGDRDAARRFLGVPFYLNTPSGKNKVFDPSNNTERTLNKSDAESCCQ